MKRPFLLIGLAALLFSVVSLSVPHIFRYVFPILAVACISFSVYFALRKNTVFFVSSLVVLLCAVSCFSAVRDTQELKKLPSDVTVVGEVTAVSDYDDAVVYTLKTELVNGKEQKLNIRLISARGYMLDMGDKITADLRLFDICKTSNLANGVQGSAYIRKLITVKEAKTSEATLIGWRGKITQSFVENLSYDEASLLLGLTLGERSYLSEQTETDIRRSGISHAVAVSGMHLAIVAGAFLALFGKSRRAAGVFGIVFLFLFCAVAGFSVSVLRSCVTYVIMLVGMVVCRRADPLNSLGAAAVIVLMINPFAVGNISFQLSFAATYGVLVMTPQVVSVVARRIEGKTLKTVLTLICTTLCALWVTMPFCIWHFGTLSLVSPITNILVTYFISAALILSVIAAVFAGVPFIHMPLLLFAGLAAKFINFAVGALACLPFAEVSFEYRLFPTVVCAVAVAASVVIMFLKYEKGGATYGGRYRTGTEEEY